MNNRPTPSEKIRSLRDGLAESLNERRVRLGQYDDPGGQIVSVPPERLAQAQRRLDKRRAEIVQDSEERRRGPQGEKRSAACARVRVVPMEKIVADNDFRNLRVEPSEEDLGRLRESMSKEGLKVPIVVVEGLNDTYLVRAGFRRARCARELGWSGIPAIVLPADTPEVTEHWTNIVENFTRSRVRPYETAVAAQTMRDKFGVKPRDFACKAGFDAKYVENLLHAVDHLPPEVLQKWKEGRLIPTEYYVKWSYMTPDEALRSYQIYAGLHPHVRNGDPPTSRPRRPPNVLTMATKAGLQRMERLHFATACAREIDDERYRKWMLELVEFCMGQRTRVSFYDDEARHSSKKGRDGRRSRKKVEAPVSEFRLEGPGDPGPGAEELSRLESSLGSLDEAARTSVMEALRKNH